MKIALDAHGGDYAPKEIIKGAFQALKELSEVHIVLVGRKEEIQKELAQHESSSRVSIAPASQVIGMEESPVSALMSKKDSSISVAARLVKKGEAQAFISAGNTGAVVGAATLYLRTLKGIKRAGIAAPYVTEKKYSLLMDAGSNISCRPIHLFQYAQMATIFVQEVWKRDNPSIGLMNVGEEDGKGNGVIRETHQMLKNSPLNFIGNIEGQDISKGLCDIILCDGFAGNVALKVSEGVASSIIQMFQKELQELPAPEFRSQIMQKINELFDFSEYGGAPLLGTNGICLICHGRSQAKAIANTIKMVAQFNNVHINEKIREAIEKTPPPSL